jgi:putative membrane protein
MKLLAMAAVGLVAALHVFFLVLEVFLWDKPTGMKIFRTKPDFARESAPLMKNQGLYNGFLAAGLVWSLVTHDPGVALSLETFFLGCVIVAGIVGAITAKWTILVFQAMPAVVALALVYAARG